ncbi:MAG: YciI family protein [Phycisphaerales bacterium]
MKSSLLALVLILTLSTRAAAESPMDTYTFVYIVTGPATEIDAATQQEAFRGHFSNMKRMAEAGDLLIAGPYWQPKSFDDLRGMWIFATDDVDEARTHASTDPPGQLGIFIFEALQLKTDDALLELPRLEREDEARRLADPDIPDEWAGRGYFWATAPVESTTEPDRIQGVALLGTLVGREGTRIEDDHWLMLVDATTAEDAQAVLKEAGCDPKHWKLDEWYGSAMPVELPSFRE